MDRDRLVGDGTQPVSTRPVLVCIPSSDRPFCDEVRRVAASIAPLTPRALEDALRSTYPAVRVRPSELSGSVLVAWYVYRERDFPAHHHLPSVVDDVLGAWRDAERLLHELSPLDPDFEIVRLTVVSLRLSYRRITTRDAIHDKCIVADSRETIGKTRELVASVRAKHSN